MPLDRQPASRPCYGIKRSFVHWAAAALAGLLGLLVVAGVEAAEDEGDMVQVELRVWQGISDPLRVYLSVRPAGGSWGRTERLPMGGSNERETLRHSDRAVEVPVAGGAVGVELRIWQSVGDPLRVYLSARPGGGNWGRTERLAMEGTNQRKTYRYSDRTVAVPRPVPLPMVTVEFEGDFGPEDRALYEAAIREEFERVATYFATQHRVAAPGLTVLFLRDCEVESRAPFYSAFTPDRTIGLYESCFESEIEEVQGGTVTAEVDKGSEVQVLAHEYVHALQHALGEKRGPPLWAFEAQAHYFQWRYYDSQVDAAGSRYGGVSNGNYYTREQDLLRRRLVAFNVSEDVSLRDLGTTLQTSPLTEDVLALAMLAVDWLATVVGDAAWFDFNRRLADEALTWQEAFEAAFGMAVEEFYDEFASYRAEVVPEDPFYRGVVLDHNGDPVEGTWVEVARDDVGDLWFPPGTPPHPINWPGVSRADGSFTIRLQPGRAVLVVAPPACRATGTGLQAGFLSVDGGLTRKAAMARVFTVDDELQGVSGIVINLPPAVEDLCQWDEDGQGWNYYSGWYPPGSPYDGGWDVRGWPVSDEE